LTGIVRRFAIERGRDRDAGLRRDEQRVTVRSGFGDEVRAYHAARAGPVVDDHVLAPCFAELLCEYPRYKVGRAAGGQADDHPHLLRREILRSRGAGGEPCEQGKRQDAYGHVMVTPRVFSAASCSGFFPLSSA
jgi:hypothetical protein